MEDTLGENQVARNNYKTSSLNPCFNGRYSRRRKRYQALRQTLIVLILVLMEDTLGENKNYQEAAQKS